MQQGGVLGDGVWAWRPVCLRGRAHRWAWRKMGRPRQRWEEPLCQLPVTSWWTGAVDWEPRQLAIALMRAVRTRSDRTDPAPRCGERPSRCRGSQPLSYAICAHITGRRTLDEAHLFEDPREKDKSRLRARPPQQRPSVLAPPGPPAGTASGAQPTCRARRLPRRNRPAKASTRKLDPSTQPGTRPTSIFLPQVRPAVRRARPRAASCVLRRPRARRRRQPSDLRTCEAAQSRAYRSPACRSRRRQR